MDSLEKATSNPIGPQLDLYRRRGDPLIFLTYEFIYHLEEKNQLNTFLAREGIDFDRSVLTLEAPRRGGFYYQNVPERK